MPTMCESDGAAAATLSEQEAFLDLLCADEDLLRAEFDAIIDAEWSSRPPEEPDRADAERRLRRTRNRKAADEAPPRRPHRPGIGGWTRQRSPPPMPADTEIKIEIEKWKVGDRLT